MSAIFGILRFDDTNIAPATLERMGNTMAARGPDGRRSVAAGPVGLGHCLLRVNEEDLFEAQPLRDRAADLLLVADLRLDNRDELAERLGVSAAALRDMPDSALLLAAYRHWGEACVEHLLGDFAFALWDGRRNTLLLVRDPIGQRGLYYHIGPDAIVFASEVKALWAVDDVPRALSEEGIGRFLLMPVDQKPEITLFEGIAVQPGGTVMTITRDGRHAMRTYWEPHAAPEHIGRDDAYYLATYRRIVEEAIGCRVRRLTRSPALSFSGGFDSGTIAALASPIVQKRRQRVIAIASVLPKGEKRLPTDARAAAEAFRDYPGVDLHYYERGDDSVFSDIEASFVSTTEPWGTYYVQRGLCRIAAAQGARLMIDGHGGDYTVNPRGNGALGRMLRRGHAWRFVREVWRRHRRTGHSVKAIVRFELLRGFFPIQLFAALHRRWLHGRPVWQTLPVNQHFAAAMTGSGTIDGQRLREDAAVHHRGPERWRHFLRRRQAAPPFMPTLTGMHGMDFAQPFHDRRVIEFGLALPDRLLVGNGLDRLMARTVLRDVLPVALLERGWGNDQEDPDKYRMIMENAPASLAECRARDNDGALSRYVDLDRVEEMIGSADETNRRDHFQVALAARTLTFAQFVTWFEGGNS